MNDGMKIRLNKLTCILGTILLGVAFSGCGGQTDTETAIVTPPGPSGAQNPIGETTDPSTTDNDTGSAEQIDPGNFALPPEDTVPVADSPGNDETQGFQLPPDIELPK